MSAEKSKEPVQGSLLAQSGGDECWWAETAEAYVPEDGGMPRLVCPMPRGVDGIEPRYQGDVLDVSSRAAVRRIVTSWVKKGAWARYWYGMSHCDRRDLILECKEKLEQKEREKGGGVLCWSVQAIAEEIDFFLPKAFWCFRILSRDGKKRSPVKTVVDPDWPSMAGKWCWMFPEATPDRLQMEYAGRISAAKSAKRARERSEESGF